MHDAQAVAQGEYDGVVVHLGHKDRGCGLLVESCRWLQVESWRAAFILILILILFLFLILIIILKKNQKQKEKQKENGNEWRESGKHHALQPPTILQSFWQLEIQN